MKHAVVVVVLALVACTRDKPEIKPGTCLALPGKERSSLAADPDGGGLYWIEPAELINSQGAIPTRFNLVRYDFATSRVVTIADDVRGNIAFMRGHVVIRRGTDDGSWLAMLEPGGITQSLLPKYLDVLDFLVVDERTLALLADGDGPRGVYIVDLDRPRPRHLFDAEQLLGAGGGRVYGVHDHKGVSFDLGTGKLGAFTWTPYSVARGGELFYVAKDVIKVHDMVSDNEHGGLSTQAPWKLVAQPDSVLARAVPHEHRSEAFLLIGNGATMQLPTILGDTSLVGVSKLGKQTWGLVAHNSTNYDADVGDTNAETEVCLLPASGTVEFPTRRVPKRYARIEDRLFAAVQQQHKDATFQIFDGRAALMTAYFDMPIDVGGDHALMRQHAALFHETVTKLLDDPYARTEVRFGDKRTAVKQLRRSTLREWTLTGMGNLLVADPQDFELEVRSLVNVREGDRLSCSGTLVNLGSHEFRDLRLTCISGSKAHPIMVASLPPGGTHPFSAKIPIEPGDKPFFDIMDHGETLEWFDVVDEQRIKAAANLAFAVYDETGVWFSDIDRDGDFKVEVVAPQELETSSADERERLFARLYQSYEGLRAIWVIDPDIPLELHVIVDHSPTSYDYDGVSVTPVY